MKRILVLGAGKSATALIDYLISNASEQNWQIVVADRNLSLAQNKVEARPNSEALEMDITKAAERKEQINQADFVVSLLPPFLHIHVAKDCVEYKTSLVTASYISDEIQELHDAAKKSGVLLMNEIGADPGIDHMSAMQLIDQIREEGGTITSFQSYCGGIIAPESNDNLWHYKVSWNPWNIVRAGSSGADFLMNGKKYHRTYNQLYKAGNLIEVPGYGELAAYANRDSLKYINAYKLNHAHTVLRATLRHPDFMTGWATIIDLNLTNDQGAFDVSGMSIKEWFLEASKEVPGDSLKQKIEHLECTAETLEQLQTLGLDSEDALIVAGVQSPAKVLQSLITEEWKLSEDDKDLLVFHHDIEYELDGNSHQLESSMLVKGENQTDTAMAKCVGLPMAIFTKLYLSGKFDNMVGVQIPTMKEVYEPVLDELKKFNIEFTES